MSNTIGLGGCGGDPWPDGRMVTKMPACCFGVEDITCEVSHTSFVCFQASVGPTHLEERGQIGERGGAVAVPGPLAAVFPTINKHTLFVG